MGIHCFSNAFAELLPYLDGFEKHTYFLVLTGQMDNAVSESSLEEREKNYFAARERIFSEDSCEAKLFKERPKNNPVVARRMITRALGQTNKVMKHEPGLSDADEYERTANDGRTKYVDDRDIDPSNKLETMSLSPKHPRPCTNSSSERYKQTTNSTLIKGGSEQKKVNTQENYLRKEHIGAAKRLFANALGMDRRNVNETKKTGC